MFDETFGAVAEESTAPLRVVGSFPARNNYCLQTPRVAVLDVRHRESSLY